MESSIDWCEANYAFSPYIAEFWNSISSIAMILLGEIRFYKIESKQFRFVFHLITAVGIGSFLFHATLNRYTQAMDEVPMVWAAIALFFIMLETRFGPMPKVAVGFTLYAIFATIMVVAPASQYQFYVFHGTFGSLEVISIIMIWTIYRAKKTKIPGLETLFKRGISIYALAVACWLVDLHFCSWLSSLPVNPQLHAFWHIFASIGLLHLFSIVYVDRLEKDGSSPYVSYRYTCIPVVNYKTD
ncbi:hypothetical protein INT44_007791 [Umbelopsis vinacea]|uniref:Alkaline phytoceramidase n=1 Tax=Umbelopsis vinacea TaxID=44442 RepID=A0A8H7PK34_9FUNG|nr:hypothetical protein INT44_007791 [Umbelopsis vinacea]